MAAGQGIRRSPSVVNVITMAGRHCRSCVMSSAALRPLWPVLFVILWSTGFIGARFGLPYADPLTFLLVRYGCTALLLTVLALVMRAPWPDSRRMVAHLAVTGLLVHAVYLAGVFSAISRGLSPGLTALVVGLQPILTAVLVAAWFRAPVGRRQWAGLLLSLAGVTMTVWPRLSVGHDMLPLLLPVVAALFGITLGTLYQKRFVPHFDWRTGGVVQFTACALATGAVAPWLESMHIVWNGSFAFALGWLVLVLSIGAISLLNWLIRHGESVGVASLFYLTPPTTALMAFALFGERLTPLAIAGMAVVAAGVVLARR